MPKLGEEYRLSPEWAVYGTNTKYWLWSDVQGLTTANALAQADAYTQPGRQVNLSLVMDF